MSTKQTTDWRRVFLGLALSYFAAYQLFKIPPVLPVLLQDFGHDRALAGGFMSVYAVFGLLLSLPLSRTIERWGIRLPVLTALAFTILGSLVSLIQPENGTMFLVSRAIEGVGYTLLAIVGPALVNVSASVNALPLLVGLTATWIPFGQISAVAIAWVTIGTYGWQALWVIGVIFAIVLAVWTISVDRQPASGGSTLLGRKSRATPDHGPRSRAPSLLLAASIFLLWSLQYFAYMTWLPQFLIENHGVSLGWSWLAYVLPVAVLIIFNLIAGAVLRAGFAVGGLLCLGLAAQAIVWWTIPFIDGFATGIASLIGYGAAAGLTATALFATPSAIVKRGEPLTAAFGVLMTGRNIGVLIGPILLAELFKAWQSWDLASPIFAASTTIALVLALVLRATLAKQVGHD